MNQFKRRDFLKTAAIAGLGLAVSPNLIKSQDKIKFKRSKPSGKVNIAFIGVGGRGRSHVGLVSQRQDVEITAICDVDPEAIDKTQKILRENNRKEAAVYTNDDYAFMKLLERDDVDGVIIATPWVWHARMSVASMKAGKFTGVEVSATNTLEECWDLVNTYEETGIPLMILENVCYARESMAILKMIREGLFGEIVHATCGYRHDLREVLFNGGKQSDSGVEFGKNSLGEARWRTQYYINQIADVYPTHGLGPVATWFDINRGNRFVTLTSTATKAVGLKDYIINHPQGGEDHPNSKIKWKLGDIITSVIKTANDETIILNHDTSLPRPYSWGFTLHGSKGVWCGDFEGRRIYIEGKSPQHQWESNEKFDEYMKKYDHHLWSEEEKNAVGAGHGGIDYFTIKQFVDSVKEEKEPPIDVYDAAAWSVITPLSEVSIQNNGMPQYFPDFTRGKWMTNKRIFGIE